MGRWGISKFFDDLMVNWGIEFFLDGYEDEDGFKWVIDFIEKCIFKVEECGVVLGLENYWGFGRIVDGVKRIVDEIDFFWFLVILDIGNFLENFYD